MLPNNIEEEVTLDAMQRVWQRRIPGTASSSLFEELEEIEDPFAALPQSPAVPRGICVASLPEVVTCDTFELESPIEVQLELNELPTLPEEFFKPEEKTSLKLNASLLGDLPAEYIIHGLKCHEMPVVGVYIDKRICPGFKYKVRPLPNYAELNRTLPYLFDGKALTLRDIGRGYARRFTFAANKNCLNNNDNYFWSDNRPEGFAFDLELVSAGDKFTVFDANHEAQGSLEIINIEEPQVEISSDSTKDTIKKRASIHFIGKVEFYETGVAKPMPMSGVIISIKRKGVATAQVSKIINVTFGHSRYYLTPGVNSLHRRVTVSGEDINDIPTKYTMTGLEPYEIPVVGTYVDPRIVPGFYYRVRPNDRKEHLFNGRSLKLCSIGMGYAKRLTFSPDSLIDQNNYLWSDNHPDGLGLEARAVHTGMKFALMADDQYLGVASVFRADRPQREEKMEKVLTKSGSVAIVKYIHIDVTCHIKLAITGGHSNDSEEHLMQVYGLAIVRKEPRGDTAQVIKVENVGLDSQLNVLFAHTHTELSFCPL